MENKPFEHWALVELFGHQRIAGLVTEAEIAGGKLLRVDVPGYTIPGPAGADNAVEPLTRIYGVSAVYCITPVTEETARALAKRIQAAPITPWDARSLLPPERTLGAGDEDGDDEEIPV